jgi:hypothetical protein
MYIEIDKSNGQPCQTCRDDPELFFEELSKSSSLVLDLPHRGL